MTAYYNEIDPYAAQWLRNLIAAGHIAPGEVDERSITEVFPEDLRGFTQCHFFAGIGVWSYALRRAGWSDDRPVWTGSCPCQPFSSAGQKKGFDDTRHLWPKWSKLIELREPVTVFGEQVASNDGYSWLDLVQSDLEALAYTSGAVVLPAAGFGAPHGRHRIFFVAHALRSGRTQRRAESGDRSAAGGGGIGLLGNSIMPGLEGQSRHEYNGHEPGRIDKEPVRSITETGATGLMEHAYGTSDNGRAPGGEQPLRYECDELLSALVYTAGEQARVPGQPWQRRAVGGFWADADWIPCKGGSWRAIEPGTFPLAHGVASRMDKLRAYGNAICAPVAQAFIKAAMRDLCI